MKGFDFLVVKVQSAASLEKEVLEGSSLNAIFRTSSSSCVEVLTSVISIFFGDLGAASLEGWALCVSGISLSVVCFEYLTSVRIFSFKRWDLNQGVQLRMKEDESGEEIMGLPACA